MPVERQPSAVSARGRLPARTSATPRSSLLTRRHSRRGAPTRARRPRPFDLEDVGVDDDLEKERVGHAVDRRPPEVPREQRPLRYTGRGDSLLPEHLLRLGERLLKADARLTSSACAPACSALTRPTASPARVTADRARDPARILTASFSDQWRPPIVEAPEDEKHQVQRARRTTDQPTERLANEGQRSRAAQPSGASNQTLLW